ncbi:L-asparaginase [Sinorhizobium kostiense]|uniref:asparaginase n=1 Tax=Sinorhizobium kostiense TaxID=76747 RepID=A0ABS4R498_9HYPH|nr:type I asparaginase [Sinorhizobium kostiense]MBP2237713.1 L-asparaginase [Sinorhizobium kostiense]
MSRRVLILHTGGTIGMESSPSGLRPMAGFGALLKRRLGETASATPLPDCDIVELERLIDSANLQPAQWPIIAGELVRRWDAYDGFVVLHGTDTMAWTASALSFMLTGLDKPVILTGAQIPLTAPRSDALENLEMALILAAQDAIREVGLCFGRKLFRGNRSRKIATDRFDAFDSPNYPPIAEAGIKIVLHRELLLAASPRAFYLPEHFDPEAVAVLTIHPGLSSRVVEAVLAEPKLRGVVLRSYGVGNVPEADARLLTALGDAVARGVTVVNTTQCVIGAVAQDTYATGAALARIGVVSGGDTTLEAAFAKLHVLIAEGLPVQEIRSRMAEPVAGEMAASS